MFSLFSGPVGEATTGEEAVVVAVVGAATGAAAARLRTPATDSLEVAVGDSVVVVVAGTTTTTGGADEGVAAGVATTIAGISSRRPRAERSWTKNWTPTWLALAVSWTARWTTTCRPKMPEIRLSLRGSSPPVAARCGKGEKEFFVHFEHFTPQSLLTSSVVYTVNISLIFINAHVHYFLKRLINS